MPAQNSVRGLQLKFSLSQKISTQSKLPKKTYCRKRKLLSCLIMHGVGTGMPPEIGLLNEQCGYANSERPYSGEPATLSSVPFCSPYTRLTVSDTNLTTSGLPREDMPTPGALRNVPAIHRGVSSQGDDKSNPYKAGH